MDKDDKETPNANTGSASDMEAPPLKPFSKKGAHSTGKPSGQLFRPEIPRRVAEIPGVSRRGDHRLSLEDDANRLTVGRNICLKGEITACEKLVVEGRVEAVLAEASMIEVMPTGFYKGSANVQEADICGCFEGSLVATDILTIRKGGRISGSVRYGKIVIESGGEISGDMASLEEAEATAGSGGAE